MQITRTTVQMQLFAQGLGRVPRSSVQQRMTSRGIAPPVYRPGQSGAAQGYAAGSGAPPVYRPSLSVKTVSGGMRGGAPPVYSSQAAAQPMRAPAITRIAMAKPKFAPPPNRMPPVTYWKPSAITIQRKQQVVVNENCTQSLKDPGALLAKVYGWNAHFVINCYGDGTGETPAIKVIIYLDASGATNEVFDKWKINVSNAWSNKFALWRNDVIYPITVNLERKTSGYSDYTIVVKNDVKAIGIRGLFGTESMTTWGANDSQDIPHEVGHMLGNKDEYGTVDGTLFSTQEGQIEGSAPSVMYKGDQPVRMAHMELIRSKVAGLKGYDGVKLIKMISQTSIVQTQPSNVKLPIIPKVIVKPKQTGIVSGTSQKNKIAPLIVLPNTDTHEGRLIKIGQFIEKLDSVSETMIVKTEKAMKTYPNFETMPMHSLNFCKDLGLL